MEEYKHELPKDFWQELSNFIGGVKYRFGAENLIGADEILWHCKEMIAKEENEKWANSQGKH